MSTETTCLYCGSQIPTSNGSNTVVTTCPGCGAKVSDIGIDLNPYAAPSTSFDHDEDFGIGAIGIDGEVRRTSAVEKCNEAFRLFGSNFMLISMIVLTVWLPAHLIINLLTYSTDNISIRASYKMLTQAVEWIFGPICLGGIIHTVSLRKPGKRVTYAEAMRAGLRNWGKMFWTRFVTALIVLLGMIALIIPGIIFAFRYALIDSIVIVEGPYGQKARRRSQQLTIGYKFQIFGMVVLLGLALMVLGIPIGLIQAALGPIDNFLTATVIDCATNILVTLFPITGYLIYRESASLHGVKDSDPVLPLGE